MGLIELLIAMVILNVGLFAVVGVFNGATVAMGRAATVSAATAVADKQIEIYRSLTNCAIWLDSTTFPVEGLSDPYELDTKSYTDTYATTGSPNYTPRPPRSRSSTRAQSPDAMGILPWATSATSSRALRSCRGTATSRSCRRTARSRRPTPPRPATKAIQQSPARTASKYWVYTYILIVQPTSGATSRRRT